MASKNTLRFRPNGIKADKEVSVVMQYLEHGYNSLYEALDALEQKLSMVRLELEKTK